MWANIFTSIQREQFQFVYIYSKLSQTFWSFFSLRCRFSCPFSLKNNPLLYLFCYWFTSFVSLLIMANLLFIVKLILSFFWSSSKTWCVAFVKQQGVARSFYWRCSPPKKSLKCLWGVQPDNIVTSSWCGNTDPI